MIARLELGLYPGVPWDGRSPRVLTRARLGVILNPRGGEKHERFFVDPCQLEMFREAITPPTPIWGGSPSLLPLL